MATKASDKQLKQDFLFHLDETRAHVQRLEQVFEALGMTKKAVDCPAIDGIIEEADEGDGRKSADSAVLDAALINAAQAAEHYEIARYGSLISWARQLGRSDISALLQKTLDEEKVTDRKLTTLAEGPRQSASCKLIGRTIDDDGSAARKVARRFSLRQGSPHSSFDCCRRIVAGGRPIYPSSLPDHEA